MMIGYPTMGIIVTGIVTVATLLIKFIPTTSNDIERKVELHNIDIQLLKSSHVDQKRDIGKIFDKIDALYKLLIDKK